MTAFLSEYRLPSFTVWGAFNLKLPEINLLWCIYFFDFVQIEFSQGTFWSLVSSVHRRICSFRIFIIDLISRNRNVIYYSLFNPRCMQPAKWIPNAIWMVCGFVHKHQTWKTVGLCEKHAKRMLYDVHKLWRIDRIYM